MGIGPINPQLSLTRNNAYPKIGTSGISSSELNVKWLPDSSVITVRDRLQPIENEWKKQLHLKIICKIL